MGGKLIPFVQPTADAFFASFLDARERQALAAWMDSAGRCAIGRCAQAA